jgi:hypothetical protein
MTSKNTTTSLKQQVKMEKKSVQFSNELVSDIFYVERIDKSLIKELFYSENDVVRFHNDVMRSEKKKTKARQPSRSKSDRREKSPSRRDEEDESSRKSPKSNASNKSSTAKAPKASVTNGSQRFSNDDIDLYIPRPRNDASKAASQCSDISDMDRCETLISKDEEESAYASPKSSPRGSPKTQEDKCLKTAMNMRRATKSKEELLAGSDGLDSTRYRSNIALEPWTQDMLMFKAKQWKENLVLKVPNDPDAFSTDNSVKHRKKASLSPASPTKKNIADFDISTESLNKNENASAASTEPLSDDEYSNDSFLDLEDLKPISEHEFLAKTKRRVRRKQGKTSMSRLVRVLSTKAKNVSQGLGDEKSHEAFSKELDYVIVNARLYPMV